MDLPEYDSLITHMVAILAQQDVLNRRLEATSADLTALLHQQPVVQAPPTTLSMRLVRTFDRIDATLGRWLPQP